MTNYSKLGAILCKWYDENARDLPWRKEKNPYFIWLSEIILQQTRVMQGMEYYHAFKQKYPNITALAKAGDDDVLRLWQGLGYYTRARNLHTTAKFIAFELNGKFPSSYSDLLKLKGVGRYTAAAIASISFNEKVPVVDGNVFRVLSRLFGIFTPINESKAYTEFAMHGAKMLENNDPGQTNQAIMELGALVCIPKTPKCSECPLLDHCYAFKKGVIPELPIKSKIVNIKKRFFNYIVITAGNQLIIKKRVENDIWKGLYDFPLIETSEEIGFEKLMNHLLVKQTFKLPKSGFMNASPIILHKLTHQNIHAKFFKFQIQKFKPLNKKEFQSISIDKLEKLAVPRLIEKYLKNDFAFQK